MANLRSQLATNNEAHSAKTTSTVRHSFKATDAAPEFKPLQSLMEHEITLEFGPKLNKKRVIHEELLCCYSQTMLDRFTRAKESRISHEKADHMRKYLKLCMHDIQASEDDEDSENKLIKAVVVISSTYPYGKQKKYLEELIATQKELMGMSLQSRLEALNSKGLRSVAQPLFDQLHEYKHRTLAAAKTAPATAAVQRCLILPNVEERVVKSLMSWLYGQGSLNFDDAQHLYSLQGVADDLGIEALAEQCLSQLTMRTTDTIKNALGYGLTLQTLLGFGSDEEIVKLQGSSCAAGNIAEVVFHHVLKDSSSPERLRQLVVTNLAIYLDTPLWSQIASTATENMSKLIIEAMLHAKETKKESDGVKMEGRVISQ